MKSHNVTIVELSPTFFC